MLIGLSGRAGSGKDTAYSFISEYAEDFPEDRPRARREAFADRLKISAARALGFEGTAEECLTFCNALKEGGHLVLPNFDFPDGHWEGWEITGREYLQNYGTEAHREVFDYDFWVDAVLPRTYDHHRELLVVTDVRFENEAQRIRDLEGEVWHIYRPEVEAGDSHASEQPLPVSMIHHTIQNTRSLDHFRDQVLSLMERYVYA